MATAKINFRVKGAFFLRNPFKKTAISTKYLFQSFVLNISFFSENLKETNSALQTVIKSILKGVNKERKTTDLFCQVEQKLKEVRKMNGFCLCCQ
jgi:hypothetical protein